jgi:hypothetical protein
MIVRMTIENALASVALKDLKAAAAWYEKLFRRPADLTPILEVAEWKFARGDWLQVYQLPEGAGGGSCTLAVRDIDPDGNHLAFAEASTGKWRASYLQNS